MKHKRTPAELIAIVRKVLHEVAGPLPCGHHASLLVKSVESDYQYCDLCECRKQRNDAQEMERTYLLERNGAKLDALCWKTQSKQLSDALLKYGWHKADCTLYSEPDEGKQCDCGFASALVTVRT